MSEHPILQKDNEKDRLPPGQEEVEDFPVDSKGPVPDWPDDWKLEVSGRINKERSFELSELKDFPGVISQKQDFHCVTGWSKLGIEWTGIRVRDVLDNLGLADGAKHVMFHAVDGYSTNLPLNVATRDDVLIVWKMEGSEIPSKHGGPVRTVVERKYAYKSAKWLSKIEVKKDSEKGYYENKGYSDSADPWKEQRYS